MRRPGVYGADSGVYGADSGVYGAAQECMACLVSKFFIPRATPRIVTMITTQFQYCDNNYN